MERTLNNLIHEIKPDYNYAQILVQLPSHLKTGDEAKMIIENFGVRIIETKHLPSNWILFKLDIKDMRNIALKLTEHGFFIKGINALSY